MDNETIIEVNAFQEIIIEVPLVEVEDEGIFDLTFDESFE